MNYSEWLKTVPPSLTEDSLWKMEAYRLALFAADIAWRDVTKLMSDKYSLGSARESRTWYYDGRHILAETVAQHRMEYLTQIIRLLLTLVPDQRATYLREENQPYASLDSGAFNGFPPNLLTNIPMP